MTEAEKVQPAPVEWVRASVPVPGQARPVAHAYLDTAGWELRLDEDGALCVDGPDREYTVSGRDRHALAALALYGAAFGFTRAMWDAVRRAAMMDTSGVLRAHLEDAAARIAALLPPEGA